MITRPKTEGDMLIVINKLTHEENLSQPLQTNIKQFKVAITCFTGCNGILNLTNKNNKFTFVSVVEGAKCNVF